MGCSSTREYLSNEEISIVAMEQQLEYSKRSCQYVDYIFRKYSEEKININQWENIVLELDIKVKNSSQCPNVEEFYQLYKDKVGEFSRKDLSIIGILCSSGQSKTKARLLFELYDQENNLEISIDCIEDIYDRFVKFALIRVLALINNSTLPPSPKHEIRQYLLDLNPKITKGKKNFLQLFTDGQAQVRKEIFLKKFESLENAQILCTFGFRKFISQCS